MEVFPGTWAEYTEAREREEQAPQARPLKGKWSEEQRHTRREEQRARRAEESRQQQVAELEVEIHHLEEQLRALEADIAAASSAQEAMRIHELGMIYDELEAQLQERLDRWAELAR
jgi:uncharacterized protein YlxW (UPF0749 family)